MIDVIQLFWYHTRSKGPVWIWAAASPQSASGQPQLPQQQPDQQRPPKESCEALIQTHLTQDGLINVSGQRHPSGEIVVRFTKFKHDIKIFIISSRPVEPFMYLLFCLLDALTFRKIQNYIALSSWYETALYELVNRVQASTPLPSSPPEMSAPPSSSSSGVVSLRRREVTLARVSLYIVFIFLVCHAVRLFPNMFEMVQTYMEVRWSKKEIRARALLCAALSI